MSKRYAVIVTGDRHARSSEWNEVVFGALMGAMPLDNELVVIHGGATGIDSIADTVVKEAWPHVPVLRFPAQWGLYRELGREASAGPMRNNDMLQHLVSFKRAGYDCRVLAFHNFLDNSRGTKDMVRQAYSYGFPVKLFTSRD